MKVSTFTFRLLLLAIVAIAMASCDEVSPLELRDEHDDDFIQGGEECKALCGEEGFENSIVIDFAEFESNDVVTETQGVLVSATLGNNVNVPAQVRVFDTDRTADDLEFCNTFDDFDLLFPGGPFGNVAVIQDPSSPNCANDYNKGGVITFDFDVAYPEGVTINCLDLLDTEEAANIGGQPVNGAIVLFSRDNGALSQIGDLIPVPATEDGEGQVLDIGVSGVDVLLYVAAGSGAISNICFTPAEVPDCENGGTLLDFEEFEENEVITASKGVTITGAITPAITFDTQDPEMCNKFDDYDMLFPDMEFGNILVNQHRSKTDCANADMRGGTLTFEFEGTTTINSMDIFDTEEEGGTVTFYGPGDVMITTIDIPVIADGAYQSVAPGIQGVMKFVMDFAGSGGVDNICFPAEMEEQPE